MIGSEPMMSGGARGAGGGRRRGIGLRFALAVCRRLVWLARRVSDRAYVLRLVSWSVLPIGAARADGVASTLWASK